MIKKFKEKFFDENLIKQSEHLPKKIEKSLERGKIISKNKDETEVFKLNNFINDCLNIENNINMIIVKAIIRPQKNFKFNIFYFFVSSPKISLF